MNTSSLSVPMCKLPFARSNITYDGMCDCNGGYSGPECTTALGWWIPIQWTFYVIFLLIMIGFMAWSWVKLIHARYLQEQRNKEKKRVNLSIISMVLNIVGGTLRTGLRGIVQSPITMNYGQSEPLYIQYIIIIFNATSIACYIASLALIMGFWIEALYAKMNIRMATRTKAVCIIGALVTLLMIPGMVMATIFNQFMVGVMIILIPYVVNTIMFNVIVLILRCTCCCPCQPYHMDQKASLSDENRAKVKYVFYYLTLASISWIFITLLGALGGIVKPIPHMDEISFWLVVLSIFAEYVAIWATMMLLERNLGPWKVFYGVVTWTRPTKSPFRSAAVLATTTVAENTGSTTSTIVTDNIIIINSPHVATEETFTQ